MTRTDATIRQPIGDLLNRVALRHDEFTIERKGRAGAGGAARTDARRHALDVMEQQKSGALNDDGATKIALEHPMGTPQRQVPLEGEVAD